MQAVPQLSNIRQVSDGWIKKYGLWHLLMPDGSTYEYESARARASDATARELKAMPQVGRARPTPCIVPQTATGERLLLIREFR